MTGGCNKSFSQKTTKEPDVFYYKVIFLHFPTGTQPPRSFQINSLLKTRLYHGPVIQGPGPPGPVLTGPVLPRSVLPRPILPPGADIT